MFQCRCRAHSRSGVPYFFTAADVPVKVYPDAFILANRPGTPLLEIASICRAMDHAPLGEGDDVLIQGRPYIVTYHHGFTFKGRNNVVIPSNLVPAYEVLSVCREGTPKLQFKHGASVFQLPGFAGCVGGKAIISGCLTEVDPLELQVSAGMNYKKQKLFYGDLVDGHEVVMWRGRTCLLKEEGYVEVVTGNLIGGVVENGPDKGCS